MSVIGAMYSSISGLNANSTAMEIIGNNLANVNTPAFKFSRADFADILSKTLSRGMSAGRGVEVGSTNMIFSQGSFSSTENVTDVALSGKGFFMVRDTINDGEFYTRAGNFVVDKEGYLVNPVGFRLQGFQVDETGAYKGVPMDINVPQAPLQPNATSDVSIFANLDSQADYVGPFDELDPTNTSNFTTAITVYDSLGNGHQVTVYFTKQAAPGPGGGNVWDYNVMVGADDSATGVAYRAATGSLEFTTAGELQTATIGPSSFDFTGNPTPAQAITFNFGTAIDDGGTGVDGCTQFGESSALVFESQNGYGPSYLESLEIDTDGKVTGKYTNGEAREFAQIAVVNFANMPGLTSLGGNIFGESNNSGSPIVSVAKVSGNGSIFSNTLELSNVDTAEQFVTMITTQRAFQANSRSITTSDTMLADLLNIIR